MRSRNSLDPIPLHFTVENRANATIDELQFRVWLMRGYVNLHPELPLLSTNENLQREAGELKG